MYMYKLSKPFIWQLFIRLNNAMFYLQRSPAAAAQQYLTPDFKSSDAEPTEQSPYMELNIKDQVIPALSQTPCGSFTL